MKILKEADLFDKTLILFTSDHGMAFSGGKTTVYEPGLRVPFVVRDPYSKGRGVRTQSIVNHTDIAPSTFVDLLGRLHQELFARVMKLLPCPLARRVAFSRS